MQTHAFLSISLSFALLAAGCASQTNPGDEMSRARAAQVCLVTARGLDQGGYSDSAIGEYVRARELDPSIKGVSRRLAVLYDRSGNDSKALEEYKAALRESPFDQEVLNDFGYFYIVRNDGPEAEPWLRMAVAKDPKSQSTLTVRSWVNLGTALAEQAKYSEAYGSFTRVLPPAQAWANLGMIQAQQGDFKQAVQSLTKATHLNPNMPQAQAILKVVREKSASGNAAP